MAHIAVADHIVVVDYRIRIDYCPLVAGTEAVAVLVDTHISAVDNLADQTPSLGTGTQHQRLYPKIDY